MEWRNTAQNLAESNAVLEDEVDQRRWSRWTVASRGSERRSDASSLRSSIPSPGAVRDAILRMSGMVGQPGGLARGSDMETSETGVRFQVENESDVERSRAGVPAGLLSRLAVPHSAQLSSGISGRSALPPNRSRQRKATLEHRYNQASILRQLERSVLYSALAVYHIYYIFTAVVIGLILGANLLLDWFIGWFQFVRAEIKTMQLEHVPVLKYLGVLLRCCLLIRAMSEILRSAIWLLHDAWRLQAFQLYRTALTGSAYRLMRTGSVNVAERLSTPGAWTYASQSHWWRDLSAQAFIYVTFDVMPFIFTAHGMLTSPEGFTSWVDFFRSLQNWSCGIATMHVFFFHMCWNFNDLAAKVMSLYDLRLDAHEAPDQTGNANPRFTEFGEACVGSASATSLHASEAHLPEEARTPDHWVATELQESRRTPRVKMLEMSSFHGSDPDASAGPSRASHESRSARGGWETNVLGHQTTLATLAQPITSAHTNSSEPANLCILLMNIGRVKWAVRLRGVLYGVLILIALAKDSIASLAILLVLGIPMFSAHIGSSFQHCARRLERRPPCAWPSSNSDNCQDRLNKIWRWAALLQEWAEEQCGLNKAAIAPQYELHFFVQLFQAALFCFLQWIDGVWLALLLATVVIIRRLTLGLVAPWGWLVGILEAFAFVLSSLWLNTNEAGGVLAVCLISGLVQCTLSRHDTYKFQTYRAFGLALQISLVLIMATAISAVYSEQKAMADIRATYEDTETSRLLTESDRNGGPWGVGSYKFCTMKFPTYCKAETSSVCKREFLTILDFAEFCQLTNLPDSLLTNTLKLKFEGWTVKFKHRGYVKEHSADHQDWTTFFEFEDRDKTTSVFAVRGTQGPLDIMQDINMFMPIAISQMAGVIGPVLSEPVLDAVFFFSTTVAKVRKNYHEALLNRVRERIKEEPNRRYYITGHSLGGGIAKLVALEAGVVAVTFSSPGVTQTARWLLSDKSKVRSEERLDAAPHLLYGVQPVTDLIPLIDHQMGTQLRISCREGSVYKCHQLMTTKEEIKNGCQHE